MRNKKIWRNPWFIATGSSILGVIGIRILDYAAGTTILSSILNLFKIVFVAIGKFFIIKFEVSLWFLILLPLIVIGIIILILWITSLFQNEKNNEVQQASFLSYREDVFGEVLYRWEYFKNFSDKYELSNISHYCPACKCSIVYDSCPVCHKSFYNRIKSNYEIDALIRHKIENKILK